MLRIKKTMKNQTRLALALCLALSAMATTRGGQAPVSAGANTPAIATTITVADAAPVTLAMVDHK